jgi:hypothetical protein
MHNSYTNLTALSIFIMNVRISFSECSAVTQLVQGTLSYLRTNSQSARPASHLLVSLWVSFLPLYTLGFLTICLRPMQFIFLQRIKFLAYVFHNSCKNHLMCYPLEPSYVFFSSPRPHLDRLQSSDLVILQRPRFISIQ